MGATMKRVDRIEETAAKLIGAQLAIARGTKKRELIPDELLHVRFELLAGLTKRETTMLLASLMALTEFIS